MTQSGIGSANSEAQSPGERERSPRRGPRPRRRGRLLAKLSFGFAMFTFLAVAVPTIAQAEPGGSNGADRRADWGCSYNPQQIHEASSGAGHVGGGIKVTCNNSKDRFTAYATLQYWDTTYRQWRSVGEGRGKTIKRSSGKVTAGHHTCAGIPYQQAKVRTKWSVTIEDTLRSGKRSSVKTGYTGSREIVKNPRSPGNFCHVPSSTAPA